MKSFSAKLVLNLFATLFGVGMVRLSTRLSLLVLLLRENFLLIASSVLQLLESSLTFLIANGGIEGE